MTLVQNAKSNPQAFIQLYDFYVEKVYHYFLRRVQDQALAEDLTSQLWEKILNKIQTLHSNEEAGFAAWLFAIARNELNQFYKHKDKLSTQEISPLLVDPSKKPDELMSDESNLNLVRHCLLALPTLQRETVEMRYFADLKNKEIASILEVSEKTVASNLSRALKTLKQHLKKLQ